MLLVLGIVFQMPTLVFFSRRWAGDGALPRVAVQRAILVSSSSRPS
jgi:hypothetical protein